MMCVAYGSVGERTERKTIRESNIIPGIRYPPVFTLYIRTQYYRPYYGFNNTIISYYGVLRALDKKKNRKEYNKYIYIG